MDNKKCFVYIIFSNSLEKYYVGITINVENRLIEHNTGEGKYTKHGVPWKLVWKQTCKTKSEAMILENKIKKRGIHRFLNDLT